MSAMSAVRAIAAARLVPTDWTTSLLVRGLFGEAGNRRFADEGGVAERMVGEPRRHLRRRPSFGPASFGTITTALDPRVVQLAAKFWF